VFYFPGDDVIDLNPPDAAPDHIDNLYDNLEDASTAVKVIASVTANEAGWLARYIREKSLRNCETVGEEIEQELQVHIQFSKAFF
jgi:breast cancer 2 susceptibility protein